MAQPLHSTKTASWSRILLPLIPALLAFIIYIPAIGNGFVNWDDPAYVYENLHIRHLDIKWIFTAVVGSNYHPLTMLSHTLDYAIFGLNPAGHHLTSIVLHAFNSALVFLLADKLIGALNLKGNRGSAVPALIAGLLFALHPLHVESVVWIAERKDVLSAFFFLITILTYIRYTQSMGRRGFYALTLIFFLLALLSKPMAITLPAVLLILDYHPLKRPRKNTAELLIEKIPFFALSITSAVLTLLAQKSGGAVTLISTYPLHTRLTVAVKGYIFYLYKLILPITLAPHYPLPLNPGFSDPVFILSLLLFILISLLCVLMAVKGRRALPALWLYYVITLLPVIGIVQVGSQAAADRYAYLPTIGFIITAGAGFNYLYKRSGSIKILGISLTLVALALLAVKTSAAIPVWKDSIGLWSHEINFLNTLKSKDRLASTIALYNRAKAYELQGRSAEAITDYSRLIEINPSYINAYLNRGVIYGKTNRYREAVEDFSRALKIDPYSAAAFHNRALAYKALGEMTKAGEDFTMARRLGKIKGKSSGTP